MEDQTIQVLDLLQTYIKQNGLKKTITILSKKNSNSLFFEIVVNKTFAPTAV